MLVDISMPKIDGFEFYCEIRKNDIKAKVCFITAFPVSYEEVNNILPAKLITRRNLIQNLLELKY